MFPFPLNKYLLYSLSKITFNPWFNFEILFHIPWILVPSSSSSYTGCRWKYPEQVFILLLVKKIKKFPQKAQTFKSSGPHAHLLGDMTVTASAIALRQFVEQRRAHGPSAGWVLLRADGCSSPYSLAALTKTSVTDNSSYLQLHQKHVKDVDCIPAGFRKWISTWICTILISEQPLPVQQKARRLGKIDYCRTKTDLFLNSIRIFPQYNRLFFWSYNLVMWIC